MPLTKSAKKSYISSERKRARNLVLEKKLKIALKKISKENSNETISTIDKMAKRHIISKNKAARLKSRINKKYGTPASAKASAGKPKKELKTKSEKVKTTTKKPASKPKVKNKKEGNG